MAQAFQDVSANPQNYAKYENNPKIKSVINKMAAQFGGGMGMGGGFPGGFPGADDDGSDAPPNVEQPDDLD